MNAQNSGYAPIDNPFINKDIYICICMYGIYGMETSGSFRVCICIYMYSTTPNEIL